jgi:hypothetical protein
MSKEEPYGSGEKTTLLDKILDLDQKTAMKLILKGFIIAIIFGAATMTSRSIATNAGTWANLQDEMNKQNYWDGEYGIQEYRERQEKIDETTFWMQYQQVIIGNICRLFINLALVVVIIGFLGLASSKQMDEKHRYISFLLAGMILFVVMFTSLFSNINIQITNP